MARLNSITSFHWPQSITPTSPNLLATNPCTLWPNSVPLRRDSLPLLTPLLLTPAKFPKFVMMRKTLKFVKNGRTAHHQRRVTKMARTASTTLSSLLMLWLPTCGRPEPSGEKLWPTCSRTPLKHELSYFINSLQFYCFLRYVCLFTLIRNIIINIMKSIFAVAVLAATTEVRISPQPKPIINQLWFYRLPLPLARPTTSNP